MTGQCPQHVVFTLFVFLLCCSYCVLAVFLCVACVAGSRVTLVYVGLQGLQQALEREYNASQMAAMQSGLDGDRVVLIQACHMAQHL